MSKILSYLPRLAGSWWNGLKNHWPVLLVALTGIVVALANLEPSKWYSGWDNLHGEFDLWRYTNQILGGAWLEHQGIGAPMNLAHLAEISRLPFLWLLSLILPTNLIRIVFILTMYVTGGITMYIYLVKTWFNDRQLQFKSGLAAVGGILYLLHLLTLQQFYIAFEMFTVQFAFLPLLFLCLHRFVKPLTVKTILIFAGMQFLLAPSGHTPTNFYLAVLASQVYGFFLTLSGGWIKAIKTAFLIGFLTLIFNIYWIGPNLYYTFHNAQYVQESHDNRLFAPESVASIREAGTLPNFLQSRQYLFEWLDYNFATKELEPIFNDWLQHLDQPAVKGLLMAIGLMTLIGLIVAILASKNDLKRLAIVLIYLGCASFIWLGLFPTGVIFDWFYQSGSFTEAFRNPFTKLSIIYCFASVLLFITGLEFGLEKLQGRLTNRFLRLILGSAIFMLVSAGIVYSAWPTFAGHLISEKLRVWYPDQYQQLFSYLKTRDPQLRTLPLPQLNHAGWEYYDWQFLGEGNGYQGMGFYFFGVPQPVLHRDSDRWVEGSDFFYHELKYALDSQDLQRFEQVVAKYQVDLILIDETRVEPGRMIDFAAQHRLAEQAGFNLVWQLDFLSVYEKPSPMAESKLFIPETIAFLDTNAERVIYDRAYQEYGAYLAAEAPQAQAIFPLADLLKKEVSGFEFSPTGLTWKKTLSINEGQLRLVLPESDLLSTSVAVTYVGGQLKVSFPQTRLIFGEQIIDLPSLPNQEFFSNDSSPILVLLNNQVISLVDGQTKFEALDLRNQENLVIRVAPHPEGLVYTPGSQIDGSQLEITELASIDLDQGRWSEQSIVVETAEQLVIENQFPAFDLNPLLNPSENCSKPTKGTIKSESRPTNQDVYYWAEDFGVNCNGLALSGTTTANDFLLQIKGENKIGRGLKFFLNRSLETLTDDYIFSKPQFDSGITLHSLPLAQELVPTLNWEIRSFGKTAEASLNWLRLAPLPLQQLAGVQLLPLEGGDEALPSPNQSEFKAYDFGTDSLHLLTFACSNQPCVIGLDQAYDSAWAAVAWSDQGGLLKFLPHSRLNTWANAWELPQGEFKILIFYWPEVISLISFSALVSGVLILIKKLWF